MLINVTPFLVKSTWDKTAYLNYFSNLLDHLFDEWIKLLETIFKKLSTRDNTT